MNKAFYQAIVSLIAVSSISPALALSNTHNLEQSQLTFDPQVQSSNQVAGFFDGIKETVEEIDDAVQDTNETVEDVNQTTEDVDDTANGVNSILNGLNGSDDNSQPLDDGFTSVEVEE